MIKADSLHLFLLPDGTQIVDNEYLSSLENGINRLHRGTNPEIVDLFLIRKILKPQKQ